MDRREHWETVYQSKGDTELSWFQAQPAMSLALIDALHPAPRRVIDIGGGQSALAGALLDRGIEQVAVLDIASAALARGRQRLGPRADRVRWILADVLDMPAVVDERDLHGPLGEFDLWHDRAVFHFLTDPEQRRRYVVAAAARVAAGGHLVVATFATAGPEKCSGLPVRRYDGPSLAHEFEPRFQRISSATEAHTTPWGKVQEFTYVIMRRS